MGKKSAVCLFMIAASSAASCESYNTGKAVDQTTTQPLQGVYVMTIVLSRGADAYGSRSLCTVYASKSNEAGEFKLPVTGDITQQMPMTSFYKPGYEYVAKTPNYTRVFLSKADVRSPKYRSLLGATGNLSCAPSEKAKPILVEMYRAKLSELDSLYAAPQAATERSELRAGIDFVELGWDAVEKKLERGEYGK